MVINAIFKLTELGFGIAGTCIGTKVSYDVNELSGRIACAAAGGYLGLKLWGKLEFNRCDTIRQCFFITLLSSSTYWILNGDLARRCSVIENDFCSFFSEIKPIIFVISSIVFIYSIYTYKNSYVLKKRIGSTEVKVTHKNNQLFYQVSYNDCSVEKKTPSKRLTKKGSLEFNNVTNSNMQKIIAALKVSELVFKHNYEPVFFTLNWTINNITKYNVRIIKSIFRDKIIVEVCDEVEKTRKHGSFKNIKLEAEMYDDASDCFRRGEFYHRQRKFRDISIKSKKDLDILARFKPEKVIKSSYIPGGFEVIFEPNQVQSQLDNRVLIGEFYWGVTIICRENCHAQIVIECLDHGSPVTYLAEFNGPENLQLKNFTGKTIDYSKRSQVFKRERKDVLYLIERIQVKMSDPPNTFSKYGRHSVLNNGEDNCYTWTEAILKEVNIIAYNNPLKYVATMPGFCLSSDTEHKKREPTPRSYWI